MAQRGKGAICPHAMNKSHCQGKGPSTRLLPRLSKRDPAFCTLYFPPSPEQDLGHRCHSELLFAFLANVYPLRFPSARLAGERSWCRAQARRMEIRIPPSAAAAQGRALGTARPERTRGNTHPPLPRSPPAGCSQKYRPGRFFSPFLAAAAGFSQQCFLPISAALW